MSKYKVGDQKVLVVEGYRKPNIRLSDYFSEYPSKYRVMMSNNEDGKTVWLLCDKDSVFSFGELIAAECVEVRNGGMDWRRIGDE